MAEPPKEPNVKAQRVAMNKLGFLVGSVWARRWYFGDQGLYRMRAFNDGRWLETEVKLADGENSISWGFALGEYQDCSPHQREGRMDAIGQRRK